MTDWAAIVGGPHVRTGTATDAVGGVVPRVVVSPGTVAEVQAVVRAAAADGLAIVPTGLGAHVELGAPPRRCDVLLRLARLDRVVDHQAADMTVMVEAGCPLPALATTLAGAGQWLPLDPPAAERTTVGGLVAANLSGPLRASQGTARDLVIGLRAVGADGALVAGGGRVVKNVAGYDLPKLHVGALGTVGVVVEVTFKVRPRPAGEAAVVIACASSVEAGELALAVRDAVEPLWLAAAGARALADGPGDAAAVVAGYGGIPAELADARARAAAVAARHGRRAVDVADGAALRTRLGGFPVAPASAVLRCGVLPTDVGACMERAEATARAHGGSARCLAHAASGVVHVAIDGGGAVRPVVEALRAAGAPTGGVVVVERGDATARAGVDPWGDPGPGRALMTRLKAAFDPAGVLAPGRFVAGL